jgi:L-sorbose 1-phosphate reductase
MVLSKSIEQETRIMLRKFHSYQNAGQPLPDSQYAWPLFGAGLEKLGRSGEPVIRSLPAYGADSLLMRIDAISLCYTDLKEIKQGENHPRLKGRNLAEDPVVPGHELSMTVVGVGDALKDAYEIGQRFTIQPDVWVDGKSIPFCFGMDGAYRQYTVIDQRILNGDAGNYLIPIPKDMTYAAAAITEPWACVEAAYRMDYRLALRPGGRVLVLGGEGARSGYQLDSDWLAASKPAQILVCQIPKDLDEHLQVVCAEQDIDYVSVDRPSLEAQGLQLDDVLLLDDAVEMVSTLAQNLSRGAVVSFLITESASAAAAIDVGRLHYDDVQYIGTSSLDIRDAYVRTPPRPELKVNGIAWILGAGGPMGRMHLQRAIEAPRGPKTIIASEVSETRFDSMRDFFVPLAEKRNKALMVINPVADPGAYDLLMAGIRERGGVDDLAVMITVTGVLEEAYRHAAPGGMVNIFAGMKRGVTLTVDPWLIAGERQVRFIGHSGSALADQKAVVQRCLSGDLDTNLSVAAVAGLNQIPEGIRAMRESIFPGKIVIFPQVLDFPLTGLSDLESVLPEVGSKLGENATWTLAAEEAFLESQLP